MIEAVGIPALQSSERAIKAIGALRTFARGDQIERIVSGWPADQILSEETASKIGKLVRL